MTSWLSQRGVLNLVTVTPTGGESGLSTFSQPSIMCSFTEPRGMIGRIIFNPTSSTWKIAEILLHSGPWFSFAVSSGVASSHIFECLFIHKCSSGKFREGLTSKNWDLLLYCPPSAGPVLVSSSEFLSHIFRGYFRFLDFFICISQASLAADN